MESKDYRNMVNENLHIEVEKIATEMWKIGTPQRLSLETQVGATCVITFPGVNRKEMWLYLGKTKEEKDLIKRAERAAYERFRDELVNYTIAEQIDDETWVPTPLGALHTPGGFVYSIADEIFTKLTNEE